MFSDRSKFELNPNPLSLLFESKKYKGEKIIDLTQSNPTKIGFDYDYYEFLAAFSRQSVMLYEPDPCGLISARKAVAQYYKDRGNNVNTDSILLTSSTSEAYSVLFKLLANPGEGNSYTWTGIPFTFLSCKF